MNGCNDTLAQLKRMAAKNPHGIAGYEHLYQKRTYFCMGVVKLDDNVPNWDVEQMAQGPSYREGKP